MLFTVASYKISDCIDVRAMHDGFEYVCACLCAWWRGWWVGGSNCLTPAALHTQNANPSPHPLHDPSLNLQDPRLLSNEFRKSRSDLNNSTKRESTALNTALKLFLEAISKANFLMICGITYSAIQIFPCIEYNITISL